MFSWYEFCTQRSIDFAEHGAPASQTNNIAVACPFCADHSKHMGLHLQSTAWHCRRCDAAGRSPVKLIQKLLSCSWPEAREIAGTAEAQPVAVDLAALKQRLSGPKKDDRPQVVQFPPEFFSLAGPSSGTKQKFYDYLHGRGFKNPVRLAKSYDLYAALTGDFAFRVIVPLTRVERGVTKLYGWTGRAITKDAKLRYRTEGNTRDLLWEPPRVEEGGDLLVVTEGPFDALKLDAYGRDLGARAVALLGLDPSPGRLARLAALAARYARVGVALDRGAEAPALRLLGALAALRPLRLPLPPPEARLLWTPWETPKDPGALSPEGVLVVVTSATTRA